MKSKERSASRPLHAALKAAGTAGSPAVRRTAKILIALILLGGVIYGAWCGYVALRERWQAQCVVRDVKTQVSISATPHISEELAREWFGLTNGCNLAKIEFSERREKILKEHPIVRDMHLTLYLPDRVELTMEERKPIARINVRRKTFRQGAKTIERLNWDVADASGMVFEFPNRDSETLPIIHEKTPSARRGEVLTGRALTALRLIELSTVRHATTLELPQISVDDDTYLQITTQDYNTLLVDWRIIDKPTDPDQPILAKILKNFENLKLQNLYPGVRKFYVPEPNRITLPPSDPIEP